MQINKELAAKVLSVVDAGLVAGVGEPTPGRMCVEAAVNYAMGAPHGDNPSCVGHAVRSFKIALNDAAWSSNEARTKGMRKLAIAQLGSDQIDQSVFVKELTTATIKQIIPLALRAAASMKGNAKHKDALEAAATKCAEEGTRESALQARQAADAAYAANAAGDAAYANAYAADAANAANAYAADAAYAAAFAAAYAAANAAKAKARDEVLTLMAEVGLAALQKAGSPGCEFLFLAEAA